SDPGHSARRPRASSRRHSRQAGMSPATASRCAPSSRHCQRWLRPTPSRGPPRSRLPLKRSLLPFIDEADHENAEEERHGDETEQPDAIKRNGPRKQEGDFEIEDDEENRDEVVTNVEAHPRVLERFEPALVGGSLFGIRL